MNKYTFTFTAISNKPAIELEGKTVSDAINNGIKAGVDFSGADFSNEELAYIDFTNCDLTGADFSETSIFNCEFQNANLSKTTWNDAVVYESWMQNCCWDDSNLLFAAFVACDVAGSDFRTARHIQSAAFSNLFDAILPENYKR